MNLRHISAGLATLVLLASPAPAQNTPTSQNGRAVPGHLGKFNTQGLIGDVGGINGDADDKGVKPFAINDGGASGLNVKNSDSPAHNELTLGHDSSGNAIIGLDSYGGYAAKSLKLRLNGVLYTLPQALGVTPGSVPSNAALITLLGTSVGDVVHRAGFTTPGDGGQATYVWSATNCATADNGAQVQPTSATGCWIADFSGIRPTPMIWGAKGDGRTNDAAAVQAAANAVKNLYSGPYLYRLDTGISFPNASFEMVCDGKGSSGQSYLSGFRAGVANLDLLSLNADNQAIRKCYIDMSNIDSIANVSATAIKIGVVKNTVVDENNIYGMCNGIEINGNVPHINRNRLTARDIDNTGCAGIIAGSLNTVVDPYIAENTVEGASTHNTPLDAGLLVLSAGGMNLGHNDFLFSKWGTKIFPGANQTVAWLTAHGTYLGDTNTSGALLIDTNDPTGVVKGAFFNETWTSSAKGGSGVTIQNTGGGSIHGLHFNHHRSLNNWTHGFEINAGSDITVDASAICTNGEGGSGTADGINLASGVSGVQIRSNRIASVCDGALNNFSQRAGIKLTGSNSDIVISDNNLAGNNTAISGTPIGDSIVKSNLGVDNPSGPSIASAATITLNAIYPRWAISGTTTINTINGYWNGRDIMFTTPNGAITFTGGNICSPVTSTGTGSIISGWYEPAASCWRLARIQGG